MRQLTHNQLLNTLGFIKAKGVLMTNENEKVTETVVEKTTEVAADDGGPLGNITAAVTKPAVTETTTVTETENIED